MFPYAVPRTASSRVEADGGARFVTVHKKRQTITVIQKMDNKHPGEHHYEHERKNNVQKSVHERMWQRLFIVFFVIGDGVLPFIFVIVVPLP